MAVFMVNVSPENEGERVDKYLSEILPELSRSYIQRQIMDQRVLINENPAKASTRVKTDDAVSFDIPENVIPDIEPENIPIDIVYEDSDVCIVNKPQGMVVHPANGHLTGTLVNALMYALNGRLSGINGVLRPGIVHRIDKDTSGLLIICKNDASHVNIAAQLKDHSCRRVYHAIVHGVIKENELTIDAPIGRSRTDRKKMAVTEDGKPAVTHVKVIKRYKAYTYIECRLETGRTHQIRVHLSNIGHPLMGDPVYSGFKEPVKTNGQLLHAKSIGFTGLDGEAHFFDSELPEYFTDILKYLDNIG